MRILLILIVTCFLSFPSFGVDVDIKSDEWRKLDLPNRFPQTFFVSNEQLPMYFETGENSNELIDFLVGLRKGEVSADIDDDDKFKINKMMALIFQTVSDANKNESGHYLINVSVSKVFDCKPCTEQKKYIEILNLNDINLINIYLI